MSGPIITPFGATPGTVVSSGALVTPGGDRGPSGVAGPAGPNQVSAQAGNRATIGSDGFIYVPTYPYADATQGGLLRQLSGKTTDFVDGTQAQQDFGTVARPIIWYVRQRSFNALGNPNFEVDQKNNGTQTSPVSGVTPVIDRWFYNAPASLTGRVTARQNTPGGGVFGIAAPTSGYLISANFFSSAVTTGQATLGAGDFLVYYQTIEGSRFREMAGDGHSLAIYAAISAGAPFKFSIFLQDAASGYSIVQLCTIAANNSYTWFTFPNMPAWPSGGSFGNTMGVAGYIFGICLAAGTTFTATTPNLWGAGNFYAAPGQGNFLAGALNTVFRCAYVQHEPGIYCSNLMQVDFQENMDQCQRYWEKSYNYGNKPGAAQTGGAYTTIVPTGSNNPLIPIQFNRRMAKVPTITGYSTTSGAVGTVRDITNAADKTITAAQNPGETGFNGFAITAPASGQWQAQGQWVADTGW